ncbi:MAG TPA: FtsX-like permease family protein, partial [Emticicia sp.]
FTVSIIMIVGTVVVFRQIQFAKIRPIGYDREGLIMVQPNSNEIHSHYEAVKKELVESAAITEVAESVMPTTKVLGTAGDFEWKGKDPGISERFPIPGVSYNYGKTVGWQFKEGRDFSKDFGTDSSALILNESAVKFMNLGSTAIGETIRWGGRPYRIIGVIKDMIMESPYAKARPSVFYLDTNYGGIVNLRINPTANTSEALSKIKSIFKKYNPAVPFEYQFVEAEYAKKFGSEEQVGKVAGFFAILAIIISCLGLFGLASFIAEQRTKELGIRKTLGATVFSLWQLLSKDFVWLVSIAFIVATPLAYYLMQIWLQKYDYRADISWWVFAASGLGVLLIALSTVSYQALKAAFMNPVKSLKSE